MVLWLPHGETSVTTWGFISDPGDTNSLET